MADDKTEYQYHAEYGNEYSEFNRFENLDSIEAKIIYHLICSHTKHAEMLWKLLKYDDIYALTQPSVSEKEREQLVFSDNGEPTNKRVFMSPWTNDAWTEQCSSLYVYVDRIDPQDHLKSLVEVSVETITHSKISTVVNQSKISSEHPEWVNPNDSIDNEGSIVVPYKSRETMLLKCVIAELNGLYLDGIGYLQLNAQSKLGLHSGQNVPVIDNISARGAYYGHSVHFYMDMAGISEIPDIGY